MVTLVSGKGFNKTRSYFERLKNLFHTGILDKYGQEGVNALRQNTPSDTGKTAESWSYTIERKDGKVSIIWTNSNIQNGVPIAVILQYGHGTKNGGYVQGIDYINPAMAPIFKNIADEAWKEVCR